ncbi:hypothetical protein TWF192_010475 [Orbilia oligospora]|uniref:Uncharacterized protein n=1 Tax=Orbilia oligospora TaxID=2813651 RepID=A0A6G1MI02_ORBOL|nr:hypothetical protein TWF191_006523 [Orbilia oligospora]KAF3259618.1 hypothetical protein TWF192_010475 [Orbilia oligospora]
MLRLPKNLPIHRPILRSCASTPNLQLRSLTSPAAAALDYHCQQPRQKDAKHHHRHQNEYNRLQNRSVHVSSIRHEPPVVPPSLLQPSSTISSFSSPSTSSSSAASSSQSSYHHGVSANIFLSSLVNGGIDITPSGTEALSQILSPIPFTNISSSWLKSVESAILTSHLNCPTADHTNRASGKKIQPQWSSRSWKDWVKYQVDVLSERFVAMEGWDGVHNLEYWLGDDGLVVKGDEEVRRILEVLVRNGWVVAVAEEGADGVYEVVRPGKVGRFEADRFTF